MPTAIGTIIGVSHLIVGRPILRFGPADDIVVHYRMASHHDRPWGNYAVVDRGPTHQVKRIVVAPGMRLSYQVHRRRSEHWFVIQGHGKATLDGAHTDVMLGVTVDVSIGVAHRIENLGSGDLVFIEVQHGDYFGEDDIIRLKDDFGRVSAQADDTALSRTPDRSLTARELGQVSPEFMV